MNKLFEQANPFDRGSLKDRDLFIGETHTEYLEQIKSKMLRSKNSKKFPNVLITGDRGVGKTSLVNVIANESMDINACIVSIRLTADVCKSVWSFYFVLLKSIIVQMDDFIKEEDRNKLNLINASINNSIQDSTQRVLSFVSSYYSYLNTKSVDVDPQEIVDDLNQIIKILNKKILIIFDESNNIYEKSNIIEILRIIIDNGIGVSFILAGETPGLNSKLNLTFGQINRYFTVCNLSFFGGYRDIQDFFTKSLRSIGWEDKDIESRRYFPNFKKTMIDIYFLTFGNPYVVTIIAREMYYQSSEIQKMKLTHAILDKIADDIQNNGEKHEIKLDEEQKLIKSFSWERVNYILNLSNIKLKWLLILLNNQIYYRLNSLFDIYKIHFNKVEFSFLESLFNEFVDNDVFIKHTFKDNDSSERDFIWLYRGTTQEINWLSLKFRKNQAQFYYRQEDNYPQRLFDSINRRLDFSYMFKGQSSTELFKGFTLNGIEDGVEYDDSRIKNFFNGVSDSSINNESLEDIDNKDCVSLLTNINQSISEKQFDLDILTYVVYYKHVNRYLCVYFYNFYNSDNPINSKSVRDELDLIKLNAESYNDVEFNYNIEKLEYSDVDCDKFYRLILSNNDLPMQNQRESVRQVLMGMMKSFDETETEDNEDSQLNQKFDIESYTSNIELIIQKIDAGMDLSGLLNLFNSLSYILIKNNYLKNAKKILLMLRGKFNNLSVEKHERDVARFVIYNLAVVNSLLKDYKASIIFFENAIDLNEEFDTEFKPGRMFVIDPNSGLFKDKPINEDEFDYLKQCEGNIEIIKEKFL